MNSHRKFGHFRESALRLAGGSFLSQLVSLAALPILTRIYTPADFGNLAAFAAAVSIIASVACLRLEIAVPLSEAESEAKALLALCFLSTASVAAMTFIGTVAIDRVFPSLLIASGLDRYNWLLATGVLLAGTYNASVYWATRKGRFNAISTSRVSQALGAVTVQLLAGMYTGSAVGLLVGYVISVGAGGIALIARVDLGTRTFRKLLRSGALLKTTILKHSAFPRYSALEALANTAGTQLPILMISFALSSPHAGLIMIALKVMQAPLTLIGTAVSQVYLHAAAAKNRTGELAQLTSDVLIGLFKTGLGPLIAGGILAPELFRLIFGPKWAAAGQIVILMLPWLACQFLASPISMAMHVAGRQRLMLVLALFGLAIRCVPVALAGVYLSDAMLLTYALASFVFYFSCLLFFIAIARVDYRTLIRRALQNWPTPGAWIVAAIAIKYTAFQ